MIYNEGTALDPRDYFEKSSTKNFYFGFFKFIDRKGADRSVSAPLCVWQNSG